MLASTPNMIWDSTIEDLVGIINAKIQDNTFSCHLSGAFGSLGYIEFTDPNWLLIDFHEPVLQAEYAVYPF